MSVGSPFRTRKPRELRPSIDFARGFSCIRSRGRKTGNLCPREIHLGKRANGAWKVKATQLEDIQPASTLVETSNGVSLDASFSYIYLALCLSSPLILALTIQPS